jgi:O-succinylbenzoic acid--CoA ligase
MIVNIGTHFFSAEDIIHMAEEDVQAFPAYAQQALRFLQAWFTAQDGFEQYTSGSTGEPKRIYITREQMIQSAELTITYLGLQHLSHAWLPISAEYIGGKMLLVRALLCGMDISIAEPTSVVFSTLPAQHTFNFTSVVPMQLQELLHNHTAVERAQQFNHILIGGAALDASLEAGLQHLQHVQLWHTYGMTETVSHIALRKINGALPEKAFTAFSNVELDTDERSCLRIKAAVTNYQWLQTNDVVELSDEKTFRVLGRADDVVNSGGVKIFPATIEPLIKQALDECAISYSFFTGSIPDERLGQQYVLVMESAPLDARQKELLFAALRSRIPRFQVPKALFFLDRFLYTDSGKLNKMKMLSAFSHSGDSFANE